MLKDVVILAATLGVDVLVGWLIWFLCDWGVTFYSQALAEDSAIKLLASLALLGLALAEGLSAVLMAQMTIYLWRNPSSSCK